MISSPLLLPVFALIAWTLLIWIWMYPTRVPAIVRPGMAMDPSAPRGEQMKQLPAAVRWKADNYDHLLEQPTLFYAAALALAVMGHEGTAALACAWAYFGLRVVHSLVQTLGNKIELRFAVFVLSTLPLFGMVLLGIRELT